MEGFLFIIVFICFSFGLPFVLLQLFVIASIKISSFEEGLNNCLNIPFIDIDFFDPPDDNRIPSEFELNNAIFY